MVSNKDYFIKYYNSLVQGFNGNLPPANNEI